jgi:hypothetical protein
VAEDIEAWLRRLADLSPRIHAAFLSRPDAISAIPPLSPVELPAGANGPPEAVRRARLPGVLAMIGTRRSATGRYPVFHGRGFEEPAAKPAVIVVTANGHRWGTVDTTMECGLGPG